MERSISLNFVRGMQLRDYLFRFDRGFPIAQLVYGIDEWSSVCFTRALGSVLIY